MDENLCYDCFMEKMTAYRDVTSLNVSFWPGEAVCDCCGEYGAIVQDIIEADDE